MRGRKKIQNEFQNVSGIFSISFDTLRARKTVPTKNIELANWYKRIHSFCDFPILLILSSEKDATESVTSSPLKSDTES